MSDEKMTATSIIGTVMDMEGIGKGELAWRIGREQSNLNAVLRNETMTVNQLYTILKAMDCDIVVMDNKNSCAYYLGGTDLSRKVGAK